MPIEIRPVRPEEYEEAGRVTALAYHEFAPPGNEAWADYLVRLADVRSRAERATVLVAVEDGAVLGTTTLELDQRIDASSGHEREPLAPGESHIRMLGVHPDVRGRGVGRRLMEASIDEARKAGKTLMTLNTTEKMIAAQHMYESLGFEGGPDVVFDDGFRMLSYSLTL